MIFELKQKKNIIFDWSGVISDDLNPVYKSVNEVMLSLTGKQISKDEFKKEFTLPVKNFWSKYIDDLDEEKILEIHELFKEVNLKSEKPETCKNVMDTLGKLYSNGVNMIVVSSVPSEKLLQESEDFGFRKYFKEINGGVKDKVKVIKEILEKNNFKPKDTIYIGDMTHDIETGKLAGVTTVAITTGYQNKETLEKHNPDSLISDISDLLKLV